MMVINMKKIKKLLIYGIAFFVLGVGLIKVIDLEDLGKDKEDILSTSSNVSNVK